MTESDDTLTNALPSERANDANPIDLCLIPIHQQEQITSDFGLLDGDDDDSEDNLTILDLKPIRKSDYDLSVFDVLAQQCDAVLRSTVVQAKPTPSITCTRSHSSNLTISTMINDYEQRFQCSLQKLTVPSWYTEPAPSSKLSNQPPLSSTGHYNRDTHRTPEIVHVQRPNSYRSYRSSLGTSPSPSIHSWHPQQMIDGVNYPALLPSSTTRRHQRHHRKHEKGIERVTKSSQWYRPTQFTADKEADQISTSKASLSQPVTSKSNQYDEPTNDQRLASRPRVDRTSPTLIDQMLADDVKSAVLSEPNSSTTDNHSLTNDKHDDQRINSNGFQTMPLADEKIPFGRVELEDVTDEEEAEYDKRPSTANIHPAEEIDDDDEKNALLERLASSLVDSILNEVLHLKDVEYEAETNAGVRELSDDENGLRELDENDINGTDEFIVLPTNAGTLDDDRLDQANPPSSMVSGGSLNRLYTFSRTNDDGMLNCKPSTNQESPASTLMIVDKEFPTTHSLLNTNPEPPTLPTVQLEHTASDNSLPIYRSHIQKRHINLGRYYDGMMRAGTSQIPTHDLRCNLFLNNTTSLISAGGVTEETVRQGRLLLDSIPNTTQLKNEITDDDHEQSTPVRPILKNTRFTLADESIPDKHVLRIEEDARVSPRTIVTTTTVTEEYRRVRKKIIEELDGDTLLVDTNGEVCRDSDYSSNQERPYAHKRLVLSAPVTNPPTYELLSNCYSGYSYICSDFLVPIKSPLVSIVSSLQSTTDEAYESEPTVTTSPHSPTMSSSTAATNHIHADLEHEFEYPSPPPPVPDRRLKPAHLRPPPPPTKPRRLKQPQNNLSVEKRPKSIKISPLTAIQQLIASAPNDTTLSSARTLSSRHYCGSIPLSNDYATTSTSNSSPNGQTKEISKTNSKKFNGSTFATHNEENQKIVFTKSSTSSLNRNKGRKTASACFDETTNGLAIRLPIPASDEHDAATKPNLPRISVSSSGKAIEGAIKHRPISENLHSRRSSVYETSV